MNRFYRAEEVTELEGSVYLYVNGGVVNKHIVKKVLRKEYLLDPTLITNWLFLDLSVRTANTRTKQYATI